MFNLTINRIESLQLSAVIAWLLGECMQARGQQKMWMRQRPEALEVLREQAIIQSAESSNRIEGVTVAADRLRPVVLGKARPLDRPEEELRPMTHFRKKSKTLRVVRPRATCCAGPS
jgi:hypothetical protein